MNWPAPDVLPPPAPPTPPTSPTSSTPPTSTAPLETAQQRRERSGVPAATWIALLGGALVVVAAASVVVSSWDAIGRTARVVGLVAVTAGLLAWSERLRRPAPSTSNIAAHLSAVLVGSVGIAVASLFGVTWPGCLVAGGTAAFAAATWQSDRWRPHRFGVVQVGSVSIAATGAAELTGTTGGLIAAIAALVWLARGAERRAVVLSVAAVLSPVLGALADAGIGAGAFERAGLVGDRLGWSGPIVGLLTAMVLATVARRRGDDALLLGAAAAPVVGAVTGLAAIDGSAVAWWCVPALTVIVAELLARRVPPPSMSPRSGDAVTGATTGATIAIDWLVATVAGCSLLSPGLVAATGAADGHLGPAWAVPCAVTLFALVPTALRWHRRDRVLAEVVVAALAALAVAVTAALGTTMVVVAVTGVAATAVTALAGRRRSGVATYVPAIWSLWAVEQVATPFASVAWYLGAALVAVSVAIVVASRARSAADAGPTGWFEAAALILAGGGSAMLLVDRHPATAWFVGAVLVGTALALVDARWTALHIGATGVVGVIVAPPIAAVATGDATGWIGWVVGTVGLVATNLVRRWRASAHAAAAGAVITAAAVATASGVSAEAAAVGATSAVVALTGLALSTGRRTPLDSAAITAGVLLAWFGTLPVHPAWQSAVWVVLGLQLTAYGATVRQPLLTHGGVATTAAAVLSWGFTTDLDDRVRHLVEPADVTVGDVWMFAATLSALCVGWVLRRTSGVNSWIAYGVGLTIGGLWLVGVQLDRDPVWALPAAVTLGVVAAAAGAWRRLAAPLVGGTVIASATTFVAMGSDVRAVPTWTWLAVGGLSLLGVAVLIERTSQHGTTWRDLLDRWD